MRPTLASLARVFVPICSISSMLLYNTWLLVKQQRTQKNIQEKIGGTKKALITFILHRNIIALFVVVMIMSKFST